MPTGRQVSCAKLCHDPRDLTSKLATLAYISRAGARSPKTEHSQALLLVGDELPQFLYILF